ncbi:MAG: VPLPA-CTERM sorting domain-containing protein [Paracoccaceae bacterium]
MTGFIAADGQSASLTDIFDFETFSGCTSGFGDCAPTPEGSVQGLGFSVSFADAASAKAAWVLPAQQDVAPVPLPAGGLLLLSGMAGIAGLKRRKARAA